MCGRFVSTSTPEQIANYFGASFEEGLAAEAASAAVIGDGAPATDAADSVEAPRQLPANFNVAPTNDVYAVVNVGGDDLAVRPFHWGLVPLWAKDVKIGSSMINARSETINEKPAYKGVFKKYRCIIPMDGFYEWQAAQPGAPVGKNGKPIKQPMFIHRTDGEPLAVAGLWSAWRPKGSAPDAPWLHSCTVITTSANNTMAPVHDRMPVILPASKWQQWLDPTETDLDALVAMLVPAPDALLTMHPVSTAVNNVRNKGEDLIVPVDASTTEEAQAAQA